MVIPHAGRRIVFWLAVVLASLVVATPRPATAADLADILDSLVKSHDGDISVAIEHLDTGESYAHQAAAVMPTASLIKFPVMIEAYRQAAVGQVSLEQFVILRDEDKVPGSGILTSHFSAGMKMSLRDAIRLMIVYSDNTATNLVVDQIGIASVRDTMQQLGAPNTRLNAKVYRRDTSIDVEASRQYGLGSTTAAEMLSLLKRLHAEELVSSEASRAMTSHLTACEDRTKLLRDLPPEVKMAHKTGAVSNARCDAGILYTPRGPVAVCVLTANNDDRRFTDENSAQRLMGEIGRRVYRHFTSSQDAAQVRPVTLKVGDHGKLVEYLQKTLNARLTPSPGIAVDGDFGPQTQAAVRSFQAAQKLDESGVVDPATWKALGPLVTRDAPVPPPDEINSARLTVAPADTLDGVPFVTCRAWIAVDAATGDVIHGDQIDKPLDIASTTKVMTAYLVFEAAANNPDIWDEVVTISPRADATVGSTAGVMAGEQLPVRELMYGLLLPSGNDAAVALAEHFGPRLAITAESKKGDPLAQFVAAMNRKATELGMSRTHFANPHGLTQTSHKSTARDLATLATKAIELPHFAEYVRTRQRGYTVRSTSGYQRHLLWKNTNRLLATAGYEGVKTGTTTAAGACLISMARRDEDAIILVTLGSASSTARYTDSRNLYRWLWTQRQAD